jgi:phi13 family phage major tail protein
MERMKNMGKQDVFYFEGLDDILIAMMTTPDGVDQEPEYGEIVRLPIATKIGVKGNGSVLEKWASSKMFRRVSRETKHEIGLDHVGIPIDVMDELKGMVATSGVTFGTNISREYPYFAFGFIGNVEGGGKKVVWYPKTQLSNVIDEEYTTAEDETKIDDVTANLVAIGLNYNNVMYASFDTNRDSAKVGDFEKFIGQPVFSEDQWKELVGVGGGEVG